ncbi:MAG: hypothetical protein ABIJ96_18115 [Elusimicrobiota bacterium]
MSEPLGFCPPVRALAPDLEPLTPDDFLPRRPCLIEGNCVRARLAADLREAAALFGAPPKDLLLVSGLGGKPDITALFTSYGARTAPEAVLPFASGALRANGALTVIAIVPHTTGESLGRLVDAAREDLDITCLVVNGGCRQRGASYDAELAALAGSIGTGYIARVQPGEAPCAATLFSALQRKGFSLVEVIGLCAACDGADSTPAPDGRGVLIEKPAHPRGRPATPLRRSTLTQAERETLWRTLR